MADSPPAAGWRLGLTDFRLGEATGKETRVLQKITAIGGYGPPKHPGFWASVSLYGVTPEGDGKLELQQKDYKAGAL